MVITSRLSLHNLASLCANLFAPPWRSCTYIAVSTNVRGRVEVPFCITLSGHRCLMVFNRVPCLVKPALWTLERVSNIPAYHPTFPIIQSRRSIVLPVALFRRSILQAVDAEIPGFLRTSSLVQGVDNNEQAFHRGPVA